MPVNKRRVLWVAACLAAMVLVAGIAIWLEITWLAITSILIGLTCGSAVIYAWFAARRFEQFLESGGKDGANNAK